MTETEFAAWLPRLDGTLPETHRQIQDECRTLLLAAFRFLRSTDTPQQTAKARLWLAGDWHCPCCTGDMNLFDACQGAGVTAEFEECQRLLLGA